MTGRLATVVLLLLSASPAAPAAARNDDVGLANRAGNTRRVRGESYDVDGLSATEIRRDLDRRGPLSAGKRFDARTEWKVHWWFDLERVPGGCRATRVRVDLEVVVLLPRWRQPADASAELVRRWQGYLTALREHEDGHSAIGTSAADEIQAALSDQPLGASCALAEQRANRTGHDIVARHNRRDEQYDRDTRHGATQGARFP